MKTVQLFIGSNNTTHKVEVDKVKKILNKYHKGWTMQNALGSWLGTEEDSIIVLVSDDMIKIAKTIAKLKNELHQDSVALQEVAPLEFL